jgi:hypothetical protein
MSAAEHAAALSLAAQRASEEHYAKQSQLLQPQLQPQFANQQYATLNGLHAKPSTNANASANANAGTNASLSTVMQSQHQSQVSQVGAYPHAGPATDLAGLYEGPADDRDHASVINSVINTHTGAIYSTRTVPAASVINSGINHHAGPTSTRNDTLNVTNLRPSEAGRLRPPVLRHQRDLRQRGLLRSPSTSDSSSSSSSDSSSSSSGTSSSSSSSSSSSGSSSDSSYERNRKKYGKK